MDVLLSLVASAPGAYELTADACQATLDMPAFASDESPLITTLDADILSDAVQRLKELSRTASSMMAEAEDVDKTLLVKQAATIALVTINHATDADAVASAARLLLALCRLPGAASHGVASTNVLSAVAAALARVAVDAAKSTAKGRRPVVARGMEGADARDGEAGAEGTRRSQRAASSRSQPVTAHAHGVDGEDGGEEDDGEDLALTQGASDPFGPLPASQEALLAATNVPLTGRRPLSTPVSGSVLWGLVKDLGKEGALGLYAQRAGSSNTRCVMTPPPFLLRLPPPPFSPDLPTMYLCLFLPLRYKRGRRRRAVD